MNPKSYQPQNNPPSTRARCPVCHEAVYSRAGIHPQCAVRQSDPPRSKAKPPEVAAAGVDVDLDPLAPPIAAEAPIIASADGA